MTHDADPTRNIEELIQAANAEAGRLAQLGRFPEAEDICRRALQAAPDNAAIWTCLGAVRHHAGNAGGAIEAFERAAALAPKDAEAWASLGLSLGIAERNDEAVAALRTAFGLDPNHPSAGKNLGLLLMKTGQPAQAAETYRSLCAGTPDDADNWGWLGHACAAADRPEEARDAYTRALALRPDDRKLDLPLALVERDLGEIEPSIARLSRCLDRDPGNAVVEFALGQNRLLLGDYRTGFAGYEARWRRPGMEMPVFPMPAWAGEDVRGRRILLHDEQGLGDTIQFCRFAVLLEEMGAEVTLLVRPALKRLMAGLGLRGPVTGEKPASRFDFHCPLMSVPLHLGLQHTDVSPASPYLQAETALQQSWADRLDREAPGAVKVGLIWQGDPASQSERGRSPQIEDLQPILALGGIRFVLLQKYHGRSGLAGIAALPHVTDLGELLDTGPDAFVDTAAVMTQLDLIVSSDTGPAHLAGALGVRSWILLKNVPEWRWAMGSDTTPWYPSMRLFRQQTRGDWAAPVAQIRQALADLAGGPGPA